MRSVPLSDLCAFRHGGTPSKAVAEFWSGNIPWVSPKDMKTSSVCDASDRITKAAVANSATSVVLPGSTLLVVRSGILAHTFPVALVTGPVAFNQDIKAVVPKSSAVSPEYIYWFLRSKASDVIARGVKKGATVHSVQSGFIEGLQVPLRGRDDQLRIVDMLARAEGIVRLRRQAQQKASELIPALFVAMFGDPATNPKSWPTSPLRDLVDFQSGGTPSKARDDYWQGDVPWVSPKDMKRMALYDAIDHISSLVLAETSLKLVPARSVLIVVRGMILAHTVPVAEARVPLTINQDMKALIPKSEIGPTYLIWMLQVCHDRLLAQVTTAAHGTKKLDTARLEEMVVPVPPKAMQHVFEANVLHVEAIQQHQVNATARAEAAFSGLLAHTFATEGSAAAVHGAEEGVS